MSGAWKANGAERLDLELGWCNMSHKDHYITYLVVALQLGEEGERAEKGQQTHTADIYNVMYIRTPFAEAWHAEGSKLRGLLADQGSEDHETRMYTQ